MSFHELIPTKAHSKILEVLIYAHAPYSVRDIIDLADVGVRSATNVLADLKERNLISTKKQGQQLCYQLIEECSEVALLRELYSILETFKLKQRSLTYQTRAKQILPIIDELRKLAKATS